MERDNSTRVLTRFVQELAVPVTSQSLSDQLEKHPDYDSMLAFSEVLDFYKIPNAAYRLKPDQLVDVPVPFIAHMSQRRFGVVTAYTDKFVKLSDEKTKNKVLSIADFNKNYGGAVLVAEKDPNSGESGYAEKYKKEALENLRTPVALGGLALLFIILLMQHAGFVASLNISLALLALFKTAGLITAIMLLMQSINANNPLIQKLCGGDNGKDCNAILSSKAAKVNAYLNWSEVGFFYFAGTWLVLLFNSANPAVIYMLAALNILSLPYTAYSINYQWRVAKQWCIFCCAVQALLWLEFFAFLPALLHGPVVPNAAAISAIAAVMLAPVLTWILVKPYLMQAKQITPLKQQLRKFKYNKELFAKMLNDEVQYALTATDQALIIGDPNAPNTITMVSNPYCQPCAKAHKALEEWLPDRPDIRLQVVFSTANNEKDKKTEVAAHLMRMQKKGDNTLLKNALDDWYEQKQKNYKAWAKLYPVTDRSDVSPQLEAQKEWCKMTEIKGTPTIFINGRRLPQNYQPEDLRYFI